MKVFIPSKGRSRGITSHLVFKEAIVLLHSQSERDQYLKYNPELENRIVVTDTESEPFGKTRQMEYACTRLVDKDEWFTFCDDNLRDLVCVDRDLYFSDSLPVEMSDGAIWRAVFNESLSADAFFEYVVPDTIAKAEGYGAHLAGFSLTDSVVFRRNKFSNRGFVIGSLCLWKNSLEIPFDHSISMEDFYFSASHLEKYGAVCINNFLFAKKKHYEKGGLGKYSQRIPYRKADVPRLLARFPTLLKVKDRDGFEKNTDLQIISGNVRKRV